MKKRNVCLISLFKFHIISAEPVAFVIPSSGDAYIVGIGSKIAHLDWQSRQVDTLFDVAEEKPDALFNEGKCDASGRLWAGMF